jgi:outer membrane protein TolC
MKPFPFIARSCKTLNLMALRGRVPWGCALALLLGAMSAPLAAESLTYGNMLRRVIEVDASLDVARFQLERAREEIAKVETQLAWSLGAQGGAGRDLSGFGLLTDRRDVSVSADKRLSSGTQLGVGAGYQRDDSATTISPLLPNPSTITRGDISLRQPLARGFGNPAYQEGRVIAEADTAAARAERTAAFDQVARRTAEVFYSAAFTFARLRNAEAAIVRAERLQEYVRNNLRLGIAEEKDRLQAEAQLLGARADREALGVAWTQQRTTLNRLMEHAWDAPIEPVLAPLAARDLPAPDALQKQAAGHSPDLARLEARVRRAESVIERSRDAARDQFDAVLSVGNRNVTGTTGAVGNVDTSERVGSARLEYRGVAGQSAADVELNQVMLDRSIALRQLAATRLDVQYTVSGLRAQVDVAQAAYEQAQARMQAERAKVEEATRRYRTGRSDTQQLIQFENDARLAELLADQQAIEFARRLVELDTVRGQYWNELGPQLTARERP